MSDQDSSEDLGMTEGRAVSLLVEWRPTAGGVLEEVINITRHRCKLKLPFML
jgi:hypothetical protein